MTIASTLVAAAGIALIGLAVRTQPLTAVLIVTGNLKGNLSPCGCTKPMSGGILRSAYMVRQLSANRSATFVHTSSIVSSIGLQDQLKLETAAEILQNLNVSAVAVSTLELKLGASALASMSNLLGPKLLNSEFLDTNQVGIEPLIFHREFVIGALSESHGLATSLLGQKANSRANTISQLVQSATDAGLISVLIFDGTLKSAMQLPGVDQLDVVLFRNDGPPIVKDQVVGKCHFFSVGEKGKSILSIEFESGKFQSVSQHELVDSLPEDAFAKRAYSRYLNRVSQAELLSLVPKTPGKSFAGNAKCSSCHVEEAKKWKSTAHARAYRTLLQSKHDRDPDCVGCHVVGLETKRGFQSLKSTPQLANVGCESCHGAGSSHAAAPQKFRMAKVGAKSCNSCHVPDHSPGFSFQKYWPKIQH